MAMSSGTLTVLGTTIVSALAVGVAVGAHALVGTPHSGVGADLVMSDDFCTLMGQTLTFGIDGAAPLADFASTIDATSDNEVVALAILHAQGKQMIDAAGPLAEIERHAAEIVTNPELSAAFEASAKALDLQAEVFGPLARDAESTERFLARVDAAAAKPETEAVSAAGDEANALIIAYVGAECGISLDGKAVATTKPTLAAVTPTPGVTNSASPDSSQAEAAAKADVTQIGEALTTMFAEWSEGDPLPTLDLVDGFYSVDNGNGSWSGFSAASSDSAIAEQFIVGPNDWCVSVTVFGTRSVTYNYSSLFGLLEGTCA